MQEYFQTGPPPREPVSFFDLKLTKIVGYYIFTSETKEQVMISSENVKTDTLWNEGNP
jgi:hypothetical protein